MPNSAALVDSLAMSQVQESTGETIRVKQKVAGNFGSAASSYDSKAGIQAEIAKWCMFNFQQLRNKQEYPVAVDLGCATGRQTVKLNQYCQQLIGLDIAYGMASFAQQQYKNRASWLVADMEALPFANDSIDLAYSCMAMQWCREPLSMAKSIKQVLRSGGAAHMAILCRGSFRELGEVWASSIGLPPFNALHSGEDWTQAFLQVGLGGLVRHKTFVDVHQNASSALHSITDIGAATRLQDGAADRLTPSKLKRFHQACKQRFCATNGVPVTYEVYLFQLENSESSLHEQPIRLLRS